MKHVISTGTLIEFIVAASISIVGFGISLAIRHPGSENATFFSSSGFMGCFFILGVAIYLICKGRRYEKRTEENRRRALRGIEDLLAEAGPMSKEELYRHPEYEWSVGAFFTGAHWYVDVAIGVIDMIDMDGEAIDMDGEVKHIDLDYCIDKLLFDGCIEKTIDDKYQLNRGTVKAFTDERCVSRLPDGTYAKTERDELYDAYVAYCKDKGIIPVSYSFFADEIYRMTDWRECEDTEGKRYFLIGIKRT